MKDFENRGVKQEVAERAEIAADCREINQGDKAALVRRDLNDFQNGQIGAFPNKFGIQSKARVGVKQIAQAFGQVAQTFRRGDVKSVGSGNNRLLEAFPVKTQGL